MVGRHNGAGARQAIGGAANGRAAIIEPSRLLDVDEHRSRRS
jgi:hypothetical protein